MRVKVNHKSEEQKNLSSNVLGSEERTKKLTSNHTNSSYLEPQMNLLLNENQNFLSTKLHTFLSTGWHMHPTCRRCLSVFISYTIFFADPKEKLIEQKSAKIVSVLSINVEVWTSSFERTNSIYRRCRLCLQIGKTLVRGEFQPGFKKLPAQKPNSVGCYLVGWNERILFIQWWTHRKIVCEKNAKPTKEDAKLLNKPTSSIKVKANKNKISKKPLIVNLAMVIL